MFGMDDVLAMMILNEEFEKEKKEKEEREKRERDKENGNDTMSSVFNRYK